MNWTDMTKSFDDMFELPQPASPTLRIPCPQSLQKWMDSTKKVLEDKRREEDERLFGI